MMPDTSTEKIRLWHLGNSFMESFLKRRGFCFPKVRRLCRGLIWVALITLTAGVLLLPWQSWPIWLGYGAAISAWNFYSLAFFVQTFFQKSGADGDFQQKLKSGQLFRSNLRLFISGILIYVALVVGAANPIALLVGLSTTVIAAPVLVLTGLSGPDND